ncbi:hypothetical protein [Polyangium jinanense]|uniref:Uncharacterized protein n=1 Tax=Polyangium jinanense TaxID=2829994 RepID=A0A9X3XC55_9BACT|nr:hypothetical protein [Polyangium jinanense]MDC3959842.1 hypothetical protein [Polyangium jinanense]MDC3986293.1 hypothetical protein [Polyangium jinanense]
MRAILHELVRSMLVSRSGLAGTAVAAPARMPATVALVLACLLGLCPALALACPDCPLAWRTRAFIREDPNTWAHLALLLLPFVVGWLVSLWFHKRGPTAGTGKDG